MTASLPVSLQLETLRTFSGRRHVCTEHWPSRRDPWRASPTETILFRHPYTKIEFVERDLEVSRPTATKYLDALAKAEIVRKTKVGRINFYINQPLFALLGT